MYIRKKKNYIYTSLFERLYSKEVNIFVIILRYVTVYDTSYYSREMREFFVY